MANPTILRECQGLMKFVTRASIELAAWFGPHCNHDPARIASMTTREWEAMDIAERRPFIKSQQLESQSEDLASPPGSNPFISYLLQRHYTPIEHVLENNDCNGGDKTQSFNPMSLKTLSKDWRELTEDDKRKYSTMKHSDLGMDHVLDKRAKLHELYNPRELSTLEFIIKTKPKTPMSSRAWFFKDRNLSIKSAEAVDEWLELDSRGREVYEKCAILDRKRYQFEKSAWITKLITMDFDSDKLSLKDFQAQEAQSRLESVGPMLELCRDLPKSLVGVRRPRGPFSLFIEAYRYQIRDERPQFQFGRHLRECGEAWAKLSEQEKDVYRLQSKQLKEERLELMREELKWDSPSSLTLEYFDVNKSIHGPCRPSHLLPRLYSAMSLWAKANNIKAKDRTKLWNELPQSVRDQYEREHEHLRKSIEQRREEIKKKLKYVKDLIDKSKELEQLKQKLRLLNRKKA